MTSAGDAIRKARFRSRERAGRSVFRIEANHDLVVEALISTGRLTPAETLDRDRVEHELSLVLQEWASTE